MTKSKHEISILRHLANCKSPFFMKYYLSQDEKYQFNNQVLMNFHNNCLPLQEYLKKHINTLSFLSKIYVMINILQGLRILKELGIVHMDISPKNILVFPNLLAYIIDFGEAYHEEVCGKSTN